MFNDTSLLICGLFVLWSLCLANNASAELIKLTDETIGARLDATENAVVLFHTPWCKHCKALAPVFHQLANSSLDVVIAAVDCTKSKKAAEVFKIESYPTIVYKQSSNYGTYEGPRTLEGFTAFISRMLAPAFENIHRLSELQIQPETDNVTFVLTVSNAAEDSDEDLVDPSQRLAPPFVRYEKIIASFKTIAAKLKQHASFALIDMNTADAVDEAAQLNIIAPIALTKFDNGNPAFTMERLSDSGLGDMEAFISENNYPLISTFDNHNFKRLSGLNKIIVCAVFDPRRESATAAILQAFDESVMTLTPFQAADFIFGHLDGVRWRTFIKMYHTMVPAILVLDQTNELHQSFPITQTADLESLQSDIASIILSVRHHTISMEWNNSLPPTMSQKILYRFRDYYPWSLLVLLVPLAFLIMSCLAPYPKEKRM